MCAQPPPRPSPLSPPPPPLPPPPPSSSLQCVPKPPPPPPRPLSAFAHPLCVVTTLTAPTAHRLHSSAIVPTWPPLVRVLGTVPVALFGGFSFVPKLRPHCPPPSPPSPPSPPPPSTSSPPPSAHSPRHSTSSLPAPLTAFTPLPLSPPGRPWFGSLPLSPPGCPWFRFTSLQEVFKGFQCVPKPLHPHRPHRPHRPQRFVHPHRPQRFAQPLYVVTTITLTAPTAHRIHSSAIIPICPPLVRVFKSLRSIYGFQCVPKPPPPSPPPPPSALRPPPCPQRFARHSTSSPTAVILCHCLHLVAFGSGFQVCKKYLEASNVCPNPLRPHRPHRPQHIVTTIALTAPTAHRLHSSAIVPTWPPLVPVSATVPSWRPWFGFRGSKPLDRD